MGGVFIIAKAAKIVSEIDHVGSTMRSLRILPASPHARRRALILCGDDVAAACAFQRNRPDYQL